MKIFRFCLLSLLALAALGVAEKHPFLAIGFILLTTAISVRWNKKGKLPQVKDNSDNFN